MSQFSHFFLTESGATLLKHQQSLIKEVLQSQVGYNCLQMSVNKAQPLFESDRFGHLVQLGYAPALDTEKQDDIWAEYEKLPIASNCIDLAVLHHVLDFSPHPHDLLREVDRVLHDGGMLLVISFRPWGRWSLYKHYQKLRNRIDNQALLRCNPVTSSRLCDWLGLLNYEISIRRPSFISYPFNHEGRLAQTWSARIKEDTFLAQTIRQMLAPMGLYYVCLAKKKTHIGNSIGVRWAPRGRISSARVSSSQNGLCQQGTLPVSRPNHR